MTKKWTALLLAAVLAVGLSACDTSRAEAPGSNLESGVSAIEDAMTKRNETESSSFPAGSDLRIGTSDDTVATPDDFPAAYNYDTGKIEDYSRTAMLQKMPEPVDNATVLNTSADPNHIQVSDPGQVEGNTVFTYLDAFSSDEDFAEFLPDYKNLDELKDHYRRGGLGDVKVKKFLLNVINKELEPIRARRHEYEKDIPEVYNILKRGTEAAYAVAQDTLDDVKAAMKIDYFNDAELIKVQSEKYSRTE